MHFWYLGSNPDSAITGSKSVGGSHTLAASGDNIIYMAGN